MEKWKSHKENLIANLVRETWWRGGGDQQESGNIGEAKVRENERVSK